MRNYLIETERLGLRDWTLDDIAPMAKINLSKNVMRYFPGTQDENATADFVQRMIALYNDKGYCFFATELLATSEFIGFIGLSYFDLDLDFCPCVEIGWRLDEKHWGKGYATEGARATLDFGFNNLGLKKITSIASSINTPSIHVMQKLGMKYVKEFDHPKLLEFKKLKTCVLYEKTNY